MHLDGGPVFRAGSRVLTLWRINCRNRHHLICPVKGAAFVHVSAGIRLVERVVEQNFINSLPLDRVAVSAASAEPKRSFVADSLAVGMLVMLLMTIVQRGVGFIRGIWFCRLLDDATVGQWSMAYDFITLITPVMLLGIPGSLPRYVEHYRIQGHLTAFLRRLLLATIVLGAIFFAILIALPGWFGWAIFLEPQSTSLIHSVGAGVLAIIAFNFVYHLVSSLRQVRVASMMQFVQSVSFTIIGIAWLTLGGGIAGLVYAFVAATLLAMLPGGLVLASGWKGLPKSEQSFDAPSMWRRLLPYAVALWAMNLLTNIFALSDRYMILHMLPVGEIDGPAAVGQYHSGRIIPMLLISLATMVSGVLLPYLAADWEAGRRDLVRERIRRILFVISLTFTVGAAFAMLIAPWFFSQVLEDRYADGLNLMPMAFVFSIWVALATIGQDYLWVAERGKLVAVAVGAGLVSNVVLNLLLLPVWGLQGAVVATLIANGVVLLGLWLAMARHGYRLDRTTYYVTIVPATLLAGPWVAIVCVAISGCVNADVKSWCVEAFDWIVAKRRGTALAA